MKCGHAAGTAQVPFRPEPRDLVHQTGFQEDGEELTIPNKHIVGEILRNSFENKIIETRVGISYQDDPERAIAVLAGVLADFPEISSDPPVQVGIEEFADSAITIGLRFWVPTRKYYSLMYQVHLGMHRALNEAGVTIPYPQQDIHVRTLAGKAQEFLFS